MKQISAVLFTFVLIATPASAQQRVEMDFGNNAPPSEEQSVVPFSLEELLEKHVAASGSSKFGSWELRGNVSRRGRVLRGEDMTCRLGSQRFGCSARIIMETGTDGSRVTALELISKSVPLCAFIPGGFPAIEKLLGALPSGQGHAMLVGSTAATGESRVHYFAADWTVRDVVVNNDTGNIIGYMLKPSLKQMKFPYQEDHKARTFTVTEAHATVRYYPLFYSPEAAKAQFGDDRRLDEAVLSLDVIVDVPHRFGFINTPHRYTLNIKNIPVRMFAAKADKEPEEALRGMR